MEELTRRPQFQTTLWSLVHAARPDEASQLHARNALQKLCQIYWYPLYAYVRHRGYSDADAKDLTQGFFARMLATDGFNLANKNKGRFRSYLLGAMKHFLANDWNRKQAKKRGGEIQFIEWDALDPDTRYAKAVNPSIAPESVFDREWALETVSSSLQALKVEMQDAGKVAQFEKLKSSLTGADGSSRKDLADELGWSESALKVAIHRLRKRYRELLRAAVADTINREEDLEIEMKYLLSALRQ